MSLCFRAICAREMRHRVLRHTPHFVSAVSGVLGHAGDFRTCSITPVPILQAGSPFTTHAQTKGVVHAPPKTPVCASVEIAAAGASKKHKTGVLLFAAKPPHAAFTHNGAERDLRMGRIKQKTPAVFANPGTPKPIAVSRATCRPWFAAIPTPLSPASRHSLGRCILKGTSGYRFRLWKDQRGRRLRRWGLRSG